MNRLTRNTVDAEPGAAKYFEGETDIMSDWSDKMLDIILNGPTIMSINKSNIRAMLREVYTALKRYEEIGPMASPLVNDPTAIVALAFKELHPNVRYEAQLVINLKDEEGVEKYGETIFPEDGSDPIVSISAAAPLSTCAELLAHELAHIIAGPDKGHGPEWKAAEEAIFDKYNEIIKAMADKWAAGHEKI